MTTKVKNTMMDMSSVAADSTVVTAIRENNITLATPQATTGFMLENATHTLVVKDPTYLTFTCATTATVEKAVYTAR